MSHDENANQEMSAQTTYYCQEVGGTIYDAGLAEQLSNSGYTVIATTEMTGDE